MTANPNINTPRSCLTPSVSVTRLGLRLVPTLGGSDSEGCCSGTKCNVLLLRYTLLCAHYEHKLSTRTATHRKDPARKTILGMETELVIQTGCMQLGPHAPDPEDPSRVRGCPLPPRPGALGFLPPPRSSRSPPTAERRRSSGQPRNQSRDCRQRGWDARAGPPHPPRPRTTPPPRPTRGFCCGRIRTRLTWGPQPPQLTGISPARNDQSREPPSRRAPPPAPAPGPPPSPPPRPAGPPPPCPPPASAAAVPVRNTT